MHGAPSPIANIQKVLYQKQLFTETGKNAGYGEMIQWIGKNLGLAPQRVKKYLDRSKLLNGEDDYAIQEYPGLNPSNPEELFMNAESPAEILAVFDEVFAKTQERIKPYVRQLISAKYFEAALEARTLSRNYPFFDSAAIEAWRTGQRVPAQRI